jgi:hypothetical protein
MRAAQAVPLGLFGALVGQVDIDVRATGAPVAVPFGACLAFGSVGGEGLVLGGPQADAVEPFQHGVRLGALQLDEGGL